MSDWGNDIQYLVFKRNRLVRFVVTTLLVYLFFRYVFILIAPFFLAFILITLFYPLLQRIQKIIPMKKKFLAVGVMILVLLFIAVILWLFSYGSSIDLAALTELVENAYNKLKLTLHNCCYSLDGKFGWNGYEIENYIVDKMTAMMENFHVQVIPRLLSSSYNCFKVLFAFAAFIFIALISAVLLEKDYSSFMEWLKTSEDMSFIWKTFEGVLNYIITFLKAQGILFLIISTICSSVLWAAGVDGSIFLGCLAGFMDVLPFIGTGIVLVPTAIWQLLNGYYISMAVCLVLYIGCICIREFLEPKLIGESLGIAPVLMLLGIYAGIRLFGVSGIIEGPLALIVIYELMKA